MKIASFMSRGFLTSEGTRSIDQAAFSIIAILALIRTVTLDPVPFLADQDMASYREMAIHPGSYFAGLPPHHAQRVLPSLAVWLLGAMFDMSPDAGFRLVSGLGIAVAHMGLFQISRRLGVCALMSLATVLLAALSQWPVTYPLRNVWQACDAWTFALAALMVLMTLERRWLALSICVAAAVFVRQNLPILGVSALLHLALSSRSSKPLLGAAAAVALFALNTMLAGGGAGGALFKHLAGDLIRPQVMLQQFFDTSLDGLFLPLLPLLLLPVALNSLKEQWWVLVFSLATIGQALLVAELGGVENTQRLVMPAIWILAPCAGLAAQRLFQGAALQTLYALTPATLALSRLVWDGTPLQHWHNYRAMPAIFLALLIAYAWAARLRKPAP
jgi:hypothetical protein